MLLLFYTQILRVLLDHAVLHMINLINKIICIYW